MANKNSSIKARLGVTKERVRLKTILAFEKHDLNELHGTKKNLIDSIKTGQARQKARKRITIFTVEPVVLKAIALEFQKEALITTNKDIRAREKNIKKREAQLKQLEKKKGIIIKR